MIQVLNNKKIFRLSMAMTLVMFTIVMFFANPAIDGNNGLSIIALQLAFDKAAGVEIINSWGPSGITNFNRLIVTDYMYAISYSIFFASLLSLLIANQKLDNRYHHRWVVYFALMAGLMDCLENTLELYFINFPGTYSDTLFSLHSLIASVKWSALPIVLTYIVVLKLKKGDSQA